MGGRPVRHRLRRRPAPAALSRAGRAPPGSGGRWRRTRLPTIRIRARLDRSGRMVAGTPEGQGPGGTSIRLGTTALAPTVAAGADQGVVEDHRSRADQALVLEDATFEVGQVPDHASVADHRREPGAGMDDRPVLHRGAGADGDRAVVAAEHGARPDRRLRSDGHITDDHGVRMDVGLGVDGGDEISELVDGHRPTLRQPGERQPTGRPTRGAPGARYRLTVRITVGGTRPRADRGAVDMGRMAGVRRAAQLRSASCRRWKMIITPSESEEPATVGSSSATPRRWWWPSWAPRPTPGTDGTSGTLGAAGRTLRVERGVAGRDQRWLPALGVVVGMVVRWPGRAAPGAGRNRRVWPPYGWSGAPARRSSRCRHWDGGGLDRWATRGSGSTPAASTAPTRLPSTRSGPGS